MSAATPRATQRATTRKIAIAAIATAALAGGLLTATPALAVVAPTSLTPSLSSFTDWHQWVNPASYDYELTTLGGTPALRMSNGIPNVNDYGNITQLSSPAIAEVGEPSTGAAYRVFTADFTIDAESYDAQPGLAVEVSGDQGGNRSGGGIVFRQDDDDQLTLSTYWADAGSPADLEDWNNSTVTIPFAGPVKIRYIVEYNVGAPDSVKVYVNGTLSIQGEGYEAYHAAVPAPAQKIDSLLFRTSRNKPVLDGAWDVVTPTDDERAALNGNGFYFSKVEYGASNVAFAPSSTIAVDASITGTPVVGGVLTAVASTSAIGATLTYQWQREGLSIAGAKSATYTLAANDAGKRISVKVTAAKTGFTTGSDTSDRTAAVASATLTWSATPAITGTAKLGSVLTASAATTPAATYAYQWYRAGALIKGATAKTYKQAASDVGREITVKITATKAGHAALSAVSPATAAVQPGTLAAGTVKISGTFKVGKKLKATQKGFSSGALVKYAWYADGELVQFSTSRTLVLTYQERGKAISVIAIGAKLGYDSVESAETTPRGPVK